MSTKGKATKPKRHRWPPFDPTSEIVRSHHLHHYGVSPTTAWILRKRGEFPNPIKLSDKLNGWRRSELEAWLQSRPRVLPGSGSPGTGR